MGRESSQSIMPEARKSLADAASVEFGFDDTSRYHEQGDASFDTKSSVRRREAIRRSPKVKITVLKFWRLADKEPAETMARPEYLRLHRVVTQALADVRLAEARTLVVA